MKNKKKTDPPSWVQALFATLETGKMHYPEEFEVTKVAKKRQKRRRK